MILLTEEKINLISYSKSSNYTVEVYLEILLEIKLIYENNTITTKVYHNKRKLPVHWSSPISKKYKRNAIANDLNRTADIASVPGNEIPQIKCKLLNADYPHRFINSVIKQFSQIFIEVDDFIIPPSLFEAPKKAVLLEIP